MCGVSEPQDGQLAGQNRMATDRQRAFVGAAEPPRLAAGKNRCCPHAQSLRYQK
jgi:hypothetical protein